MEKISVIIPTKDRLTFLKKVLPTYFMQPELKEIIFVVDGSTDGTQAYLKKIHKQYPKVTFLDNGINRGIPYSKNRGIDAAKGEYIFIAEDDLELTPGFFNILLQHLQSSKADLICGRNIFRFDYETEEQTLERNDRMKGPAIDRKLIKVNTGLKLEEDIEQPMLANPTLGRTEVFKKVRFDERYVVNFWREETDFQISAVEEGYKLVSCPHALCFNYMITNDKGGVRATVGFKRAKWIIRNNWRFIKKHREYLAQHFEIGNPYVYITVFSVRKVITEAIFPLLSPLKRIVLRALRRSN